MFLKSLFRKRSTGIQPQPESISSDAIRKKAHERWLARKPKDAEADWNEAKRLLEEEAARNPKGVRKTLFCLNQPFIWTEKRIIEPTARWTERADIFKVAEKFSPILEAIGVILIPFAALHNWSMN